MRIAVVGLGKIGLPLAAQYASRGHSVVGIDTNSETVRKINSAEEPFPGEFGLADSLRKGVSGGLLRATTSYDRAIQDSDVVVVVVPLIVGERNEPDFSALDSATSSIGQNLTRDTLVIYETTLPIGTTRNRWRPMLEKLSGLEEGADFFLAFSPERVFTGRIFEDLRKYPKLIGTFDATGAALATSFYTEVLEFDHRSDLSRPNGVWDLGSPEAAEMAKLAETTYRDVNIALANQFALHAEQIGVDVYQVIEACNSQVYSNIHRPGISVGGHCIPVYPHLYSQTDVNAEIVSTSRKLNLSMPSHAVSRLSGNLGTLAGVRVLVLGVAYRSGVKETAFSGVFSTVAELEGRGAKVKVQDPLYSREELLAFGLVENNDDLWPEILVIHTDHPEFSDLSPGDFPNVRGVYDGRNMLTQENWESVDLYKLGVGKAVK